MKATHLSLIVTALMFFPVFISSAREAGAQSSADIEEVVRGSKWIDNSRPVRAVFGVKETIISTYCHRKASDQDCKINSLFILKELLQHFKTIHKLRISFFDPVNPNLFRTVTVSEGDAALIDGGKPVQEVLSLLDISRGNLAKKNVAAPVVPITASAKFPPGNNSAKAFSSFPSAKPMNLGPIHLKNVASNDGDVNIALPDNIPVEHDPAQDLLLRSMGSVVQLMIVRHRITPPYSFENAVQLGDLQLATAAKNLHWLSEHHITVNSCAAIIKEASGDPGFKYRVLYVHGAGHAYILTCTSMLSADSEPAKLFSQIVASFKFKG